MEASITEQDTAPEPVARGGEARKMFKYSAYLDVGEGAGECEHARDGRCADIEHFHGWCRLPNPYQHQDIREKALAAKARKLRELRDPESDASLVIDEALAPFNDPQHIEGVLDELLAGDWAADYLQARQDVDEREEFAHVNQDREEFNRLRESDGELPEEEQSEEYRRLGEHLRTYLDATNERLKEIQEPKRADLRVRAFEALMDMVRARRVGDEADRAFMDTYNPWMWFVGTFKVEPHATLGRPHLPMWEDIGRKDKAAAGTMFGEAPEVIDALKVTFNDLQLSLQRGAAGN